MEVEASAMINGRLQSSAAVEEVMEQSNWRTTFRHALNGRFLSGPMISRFDRNGRRAAVKYLLRSQRDGQRNDPRLALFETISKIATRKALQLIRGLGSYVISDSQYAGRDPKVGCGTFWVGRGHLVKKQIN